MDLLRAAVKARLNMLGQRRHGFGKDDLLNILSSYLPDARTHRHDRRCGGASAQPVARGPARIAAAQHRGHAARFAIRDLFRNSLRMRPDRIIIGECRGAEALDMLQAMNTGHDGSLTTIHANSPRDALSRIETMVLMAGFDLPVRAIREQIASALDIVDSHRAHARRLA